MIRAPISIVILWRGAKDREAMRPLGASPDDPRFTNLFSGDFEDFLVQRKYRNILTITASSSRTAFRIIFGCFGSFWVLATHKRHTGVGAASTTRQHAC